MNEWFRVFAAKASVVLGSPWAFALAIAIIALWVMTGPVFGFSDTWQLIINTSTTIVTFLMVFLIQNTQNRTSDAMQIKLDEVIRAMGEARSEMIDVESLSQEQVDHLKEQFARLGEDERSHGEQQA
jgi:low affinity Fe/Cu permease